MTQAFRAHGMTRPGPNGTLAARAGGPPQTFAVSLIDRRTGRPHKVNGRAMVTMTASPKDVAAEMLRNRDHSLWDIRIQMVGEQP